MSYSDKFVPEQGKQASKEICMQESGGKQATMADTVTCIYISVPPNGGVGGGSMGGVFSSVFSFFDVTCVLCPPRALCGGAG